MTNILNVACLAVIINGVMGPSDFLWFAKKYNMNKNRMTNVSGGGGYELDATMDVVGGKWV